MVEPLKVTSNSERKTDLGEQTDKLYGNARRHLEGDWERGQDWGGLEDDLCCSHS